jgi:hypothetical protein
LPRRLTEAFGESYSTLNKSDSCLTGTDLAGRARKGEAGGGGASACSGWRSALSRHLDVPNSPFGLRVGCSQTRSKTPNDIVARLEENRFEIAADVDSNDVSAFVSWVESPE